MSGAVHIVAVGARTPLGLTAESSAAAMRAGISRISEHPFMVDDTGERISSARDPLLHPMLLGPDRLVEMARSAFLEVARKLSSRSELRSPVPCLLGLPEDRPGLTQADADAVVYALAKTSSSKTVSV